jgi:CBS domain containing-hemolysin-like protein
MPQAICTRYGLSMGAKAAPIVRVLLVLFFPVAYPISKVRPRAQMLLFLSFLFATIREQLANYSCGCD